MENKDKLIAKIKTLVENLTPPDDGKSPALAAAKHVDEYPWLRHVAVLTGVLAALAGFLTVRSTVLTNDGIYESNQAVLAQTEASDAWAEYQANSIKARVVEMQILPSSGISPDDRKKLTGDYKELRDRQPANKKLAEDKLAERQDHMGKSLKRMNQKDMLGYAGMAAQLGIAVASIAAITRRREAFYAGIVAGIISVLITAYIMVGG
jgi:hypothetical protein